MLPHVATQVAQLVDSVNGSIEIHGEYKFSNKLSNLCGYMWPVWKHYNIFSMSAQEK